MTQSVEVTPVRRTFVLMTASSFLVPAAGVLTSPMLAHALGVEGRGELAAVLAPQALAVAAATLGLPEALTYYVAKHPRLTKQAVVWGVLLSTGVGGMFLVAAALALPFLSGGDDRLGGLIVLATTLAVPTLVIGVLRGAATGRQMWTTVAVERVVNTVLRIGGLAVLLALGRLTVLSAILISSITPIVAGVVYWRVWSGTAATADHEPFEGSLRRSITSFGFRMWLGAVASMLLARVGQLVFAPLSSVYELGLFTVATTVSDVPLVVALAVRDAVYGVNTKVNDARMVTTTSRVTMLVGAVGCLVLGGTMPWWLGPVFGDEFQKALVPTWLLMAAAVLCIPGLMAAAGLSAWGRPGLRSIGLAVTVVVTIPTLLLLVAHLGAVGGALTSIVSNIVLTSFMTVAASRVMQVPATDFLLIRRNDVTRLYTEMRDLTAALGRRVARRRSPSPR